MVETQTGSGAAAARDAAAEVKNETTARGAELKDAASEHVGALAGQVKDQARNVADEARRELQRQVDAQGRRLGEAMQGASGQLQSMAESGEPGVVTDLTRQVADGLGRVADTVDRGGVEAVADDLRRFARRQPGLFLFGAAAVGFVAARLIRAGATSASTSGPGSGSRPGLAPMGPGTAPAQLPGVPADDRPVRTAGPGGLAS